jgi:hypothetical protein
MKIDKSEINFGGEGLFGLICLLSAIAVAVLYLYNVLGEACLGVATLLGTAGILLLLWRLVRILYTAKWRRKLMETSTEKSAETNTIRPKTQRTVEAKFTIEELLERLPKKLHHCEPFGLSISIDGGGELWVVKYHTNFPNAKSSRHPEAPMVIGSLKTALFEMHRQLMRKDLIPPVKA